MSKHCPRTKQYEYKGHMIHTITKGFEVQALADGRSCGFYTDHDIARSAAELTIDIAEKRTSRYTQRCQMIEEHGRLTSEEQ